MSRVRQQYSNEILVGVLKVDGRSPLVVDDVGYFNALADQFLALGVQLVQVTRLEGKVVEDAGNSQTLVDAGVEVIRHTRDVVGLHKRHQLVAPAVNEHVPDVAALTDLMVSQRTTSKPSMLS